VHPRTPPPHPGQLVRDLARQLASEASVLLLLRQNGEKEKPWSRTPFLWPVIMPSSGTKVTIFAGKTRGRLGLMAKYDAKFHNPLCSTGRSDVVFEICRDR
jgi:hypothetical protein